MFTETPDEPSIGLHSNASVDVPPLAADLLVIYLRGILALSDYRDIENQSSVFGACSRTVLSACHHSVGSGLVAL